MPEIDIFWTGILAANTGVWRYAAFLISVGILGAFVGFALENYMRLQNGISLPPLRFMLANILARALGAGLFVFFLIPTLVDDRYQIPVSFFLGIVWPQVLQKLSSSFEIWTVKKGRDEVGKD